MRNGYRDDLFPVVNFGSNPAGGFRALRAILPRGPLMCDEFYPGWFDTWGNPHRTGNVQRYLNDLEHSATVNSGDAGAGLCAQKGDDRYDPRSNITDRT